MSSLSALSNPLAIGQVRDPARHVKLSWFTAHIQRIVEVPRRASGSDTQKHCEASVAVAQTGCFADVLQPEGFQVIYGYSRRRSASLGFNFGFD